jgi:flagellar biosynthesis/type III secretory pathway M-ring protein FliF/YscJ
LNLICEFPDDLKQQHWSVIDDLECRTTTISVIAISFSVKETTNEMNQTEESIESTMSSESSEKELTLETDPWYIVMIVLSVLCLLAVFSVVILCCVTKRRKSRQRNEDQESRHRNADQDTNESSRIQQNANPEWNDTEV